MNTSKSVLFHNFIDATASALRTFEITFDFDGLLTHYFGRDTAGQYGDADLEAFETVRDHVQSSAAWQTLAQLYDYAVDGILTKTDIPEDVVIGGAEVLSLIDLENSGPSQDWRDVVALGDARFGLDTEEPLTIESVALLASVDARTVRNAISAGELHSSKHEGTQWVENTSARRWLGGRRGYKPTRFTSTEDSSLSDLRRPAAFGGFLRTRRESLGKPTADKAFIASHPSFDSRTVTTVEGGAFPLPLDTAFPLADFYELDRREFLKTLMRIYFEEELMTLSDIAREKTRDAE